MSNQAKEISEHKLACTEAADACDLRESNRTRTVLRVVKIQSSKHEGLARLQNISDGGVLLRHNLPLVPGEGVTVFFADETSFAAKVIWADGEHCGAQFEEVIDCAALLVEMADQTRKGKMRPVRLSTDILGVAYTESGIHSVRVKDLSQRGIKVQHRSDFADGLSIKILLESGLERYGVVRWSKAGVAGIQLLQPLSLDELGSSKRR
jgi:hypothetical protein